ncbi:uncharacterized protein LOC141697279 [Apium graveolens]|uniref:uncharacterized protein LOC141697279 n=1 Tax=Apium graveolens TaxID=4045 RepID=UPI003D78CDD7
MTHSRFKISIILDEHSLCSISHTPDIAELIKQTKLIIWDEAPMQHCYSFECIARSMRDIMKAVDPGRFHMPFRGITVVLDGDFFQILPAITRASHGDIISLCITHSKLWKITRVFKLRHNMRLARGNTSGELQDLRDFAEWVLDIGNGNIGTPNEGTNGDGGDDICFPKRFCHLTSEITIESMMETPGEMLSYFSVDTADDFPGSVYDQLTSFPPEYLNSIAIPGFPLHELRLKAGVVVMLMCNLNQMLGLCNGTIMKVTRCLDQCVECEVIAGQFKGTKYFIPRMELCPTETRLPFKFCRKQMPLQVFYAMTINKAQGQSLENVALFLPKGVFTHGQFYVAVGRVTSPQGLKLYSG